MWRWGTVWPAAGPSLIPKLKERADVTTRDDQRVAGRHGKPVPDRNGALVRQDLAFGGQAAEGAG